MEKTGEYVYYRATPVGVNKWMAIISMPENVAFADVLEIEQVFVQFSVIVGLAVLFGCLYFLVTLKKKIAEQNASLIRMGSTDQVTKLQNRTAFATALQKLEQERVCDISCVYLDANGLHELNNSKGHKAGDEMLQEIGLELLSAFGRKHVFRIGGDEFIVFVYGETTESVKTKLELIKENLSRKHYYVSVGFAAADGCTGISALIEQAETDMYKAKREFYASRKELDKTRSAR